MWDITLAFRLTRLRLPILWGLAVDDAHNYQKTNRSLANPGRGWIMVRAARLLPDSSKPKHNGYAAGEFETAWTQPIIVSPGQR